MKVRVDKAVCTGHARCNAAAPEVYPLDDLGYNSLEGEVQVPEGMEQAARWGADACPENAITIIE